VRLPLKVRGRDARGFPFEEDTASENLCRNGAAFVTRFDVAIGTDLEIHIPFSQYASRRAARAASCTSSSPSPKAKSSSASSSPAPASSASSAPNPPPDLFFL
jgi:hypothetical protein